MSGKRIELRVDGDCLIADVAPEQIGFVPRRVWNPSPTVAHRTAPHDLPVQLQMGIRVTEESGAKFSPPPFAVVAESGARRSLVAVAAESGAHLWNQIDFVAESSGVRVVIDLEGHSEPADVKPRVNVCVLDGRHGESPMDLLARGMRGLYPGGTAGPDDVPDWWFRPIYCGWGDQVSTAMWRQGVGREGRAAAFCTQEMYEQWIARLVEGEVPVGTVVIDAGWSGGARWEPAARRWPDLRGFVARQHEAGRRVLLWVGTWVCEGLPDEWCVFAGDIKVSVDPTHPAYRRFLREQISRLMAPDGYDADGMKIDQLSRAPSERSARSPRHVGGPTYHDVARGKLSLAGAGWGCELLYQHQKDFYCAAKSVKPDALVTSSTVHPYFRDTFDMVRLHDTGPVSGDVVDAMKARADLARAALPGIPIDTDDWVSRNYETWMRYTTESYRLGVPCIFYSERFMENWDCEPATRPIPIEDLRKIGRAWRESVPALREGLGG